MHGPLVCRMYSGKTGLSREIMGAGLYELVFQTVLVYWGNGTKTTFNLKIKAKCILKNKFDFD